MKKTRFYKYSDNYKEPSKCECFIKQTIRPITKLNGEPIGVQADQNSNFSLYFKVDYAKYSQNTFVCNIYDYTYHLILSVPAFWADSARVKADVVSSDKTLPYGLYKVELKTADSEENQVTVFATNEGVLSIGQE